MFNAIKNIINDVKEKPFNITNQVLLKGRPDIEEYKLPIFLADRKYLPLRYNANMAVTGQAYIAYVKLGTAIEAKDHDGATRRVTDILVVSQAFLNMPKKQQLALAAYETEKFLCSNDSGITMNTIDQSISGPMDGEAAAKYAAVAGYGKAATKAMDKVAKLDQKSNKKTARVLNKEYKRAEDAEKLTKSATTEQLVDQLLISTFGSTIEQPDELEELIKDVPVTEPYDVIVTDEGKVIAVEVDKDGKVVSEEVK